MAPRWKPALPPAPQGDYHVSYEWIGPRDAPLVIALGGISADRHICANREDPTPGWWRDVVGYGLAIDPERCGVLGIDYLTAPRGAPGAGVRLTPSDQAEAVATVLEHLDVGAAHAVVGASYGGMVALALGIGAPARVGRLVVVAGAHRPHPHATAVRHVQREIIEMAAEGGDVRRGLALARALAFTTYGTARRFDRRFHYAVECPDAEGSEVERALRSRGEDFATRFAPDAYRILSRSIDLCDLPPEDLAVPLSLIAWREDALVPLWLVQELHRRSASASTLTVLSSDAGHDSFLKAAPAYARALERCLWGPIPQGGPR